MLLIYQSYPIPGKRCFERERFSIDSVEQNPIKSSTFKLFLRLGRNHGTYSFDGIFAKRLNRPFTDKGAAMLTCADTLLVIVDIRKNWCGRCTPGMI